MRILPLLPARRSCLRGAQARRKDLALVCTPRHGGAQGAVFQMRHQEVHKFHRGIVKAARQSVFAPIRSEEIEQLVRDHIGQEQTIKLD